MPASRHVGSPEGCASATTVQRTTGAPTSRYPGGRPAPGRDFPGEPCPQTAAETAQSSSGATALPIELPRFVGSHQHPNARPAQTRPSSPALAQTPASEASRHTREQRYKQSHGHVTGMVTNSGNTASLSRDRTNTKATGPVKRCSRKKLTSLPSLRRSGRPRPSP